MADKVVGRAYVVVRAITKGLDREISTAVNTALAKTGPATDRESEALGARVGDRIGDSAGKKIGKKVADGLRGATSDFDAAGDAAGDVLGRAFGDAMSKGLFARVIRAVGPLGDKIVEKIGPDEKGNNIGQRIGAGIGRGLGKVKIPFIGWAALLAVPALGAAVQAIGAYLGAATSLISAVGPALAGAGAVGLGAITALGAGVAGLMVALKAETPVLEAYKAAVAPLGALWLESATAIQTAVLPSMLAARRAIASLFPVLETGLSQTGAAVSKVVLSLARVVTSGENVARLRQVFSSSQVTIGSFGAAAGSLATTFLVLARAVQPLTRQFADWVAGLAGGIRQSAEAGEQSGRLAAFLERAGTVASQLGRIFRGTFEGLKNVMRAAAPAGQLLLNNLEALTDRFAAFTSSTAGQNRLREYFNNAVPVVTAINGLIGDLFRMLGRGFEGDSSGLLGFVSVLRERLLPVLESLLTTVGESLGPAMLKLTETFANLLEKLADSGALGAFVGTLQTALSVVSALLDIPVVGTLTAWAIGFAGVTAAINLMTGGLASKAIGAALEALGGRFTALAAKVGVARIAMLSLSTFGLVAVAAGIAYAFHKLDEALDTDKLRGEISEIQEGLEDFAKTGRATGEVADVLGDDLGKFSDRVKAFDFGTFDEGFEGLTDFGGDLGKVNDALEAMVRSGNAEAAEAAVAGMGLSLDQVRRHLPQFVDAMEDAGFSVLEAEQRFLDLADAARFKIPPETSAGLRTTAEEANHVASELEGVGAGFEDVGDSALVAASEQERAADQAADAVEGQVDEVHKLIDAYNELNDMNRSVFETQADAEAATDDLTKTFAELAGLVDANGEVIDTQNMSLAEFLGTYKDLGIALNATKTGFDDNTEAGREAQAAIVAYAEAHDEAAEAVYNQALASATSEEQVRKAGDAYVAAQAATRQSIADTLVSIGFEKEAADKMALSLIGIPEVKTTKMLLDDEEAKKKVEAHEARLASLEKARVAKLDAIEEPGKSKVEAQQARLDNLHKEYESDLAVEDETARTKAEQQEARLVALTAKRTTPLDADPTAAIAGVAAAQEAVDGFHGKTIYLDAVWRETHLPEGVDGFGDDGFSQDGRVAGARVGSRIARGFGVPFMAEGGIVERPTLVVAGERGREVISPLEDLAGIMRQMLDLDRAARVTPRAEKQRDMPPINITNNYPQSEPSSKTIGRAYDLWRALA